MAAVKGRARGRARGRLLEQNSDNSCAEDSAGSRPGSVRSLASSAIPDSYLSSQIISHPRASPSAGSPQPVGDTYPPASSAFFAYSDQRPSGFLVPPPPSVGPPPHPILSLYATDDHERQSASSRVSSASGLGGGGSGGSGNLVDSSFKSFTSSNRDFSELSSSSDARSDRQTPSSSCSLPYSDTAASWNSLPAQPQSSRPPPGFGSLDRRPTREVSPKDAYTKPHHPSIRPWTRDGDSGSTWDSSQLTFQRDNGFVNASRNGNGEGPSLRHSFRGHDSYPAKNAEAGDMADLSSSQTEATFVGFRRGAFRGGGSGGRSLATPSPEGSSSGCGGGDSHSEFGGLDSERNFVRARPTGSFGRGCIETATASRLESSGDSSRADWREKDQPLEWRSKDQRLDWRSKEPSSDWRSQNQPSDWRREGNQRSAKTVDDSGEELWKVRFMDDNDDELEK